MRWVEGWFSSVSSVSSWSAGSQCDRPKCDQAESCSALPLPAKSGKDMPT